MGDMMTFPNTVEEFMEQYKIVDTEKIYTNGAELVPIFRMMQWFEHVSAMDTISRQAAIDALWAERMKHSEEMERNLETCSFALRADNKARRNRVEEDIEIIKQLPPAQPAELDTLIKALEQEHKKLLEMQKALKNVPDTNVGDTISRQSAIADAQSWVAVNGFEQNLQNKVIEWLKEFPPAQPEQNLDEWCTDCKEYDHENSCCPRWTKVIRQTRRELQDEFVMTAVDGTLWVTVDDVQKVGRVIVDEEKSKFCKQFYLEEEQRTGKWIPQDHNKRAGNISTCVYYYPTCSKCGQIGNDTYKYCPHCGAKMNQSDKTCDCYSDGRCIGTKEIDPCSCGGNKSKCDFYERVRREGDAE